MLKEIHTYHQIVVDLHAMVKTADGFGKVKTKTGERRGRVVVSFDAEKLVDYAIKAMKSKHGKSILAHGGIIFKASGFNIPKQTAPSVAVAK